MKEAVITGLMLCIKIPDLEIEIEKDQVVYMDEEKALASGDLQYAVQIGAISLNWVTRFREKRMPKDPKSYPPPFNYRKTRVINPPSQAAPSIGITSEELKSLMEQTIEKAVSTAVAEKMGSLQKQIAAVEDAVANVDLPPATMAALNLAIDRLANIQPTTTVIHNTSNREGSAVADGDVMFIPSNLIQEEGEASLTVSEGESKGADFDQVAAALRALKGKK